MKTVVNMDADEQQVLHVCPLGIVYIINHKSMEIKTIDLKVEGFPCKTIGNFERPETKHTNWKIHGCYSDYIRDTIFVMYAVDRFCWLIVL